MDLVTGDRVRTELRKLILDAGMRRERESMDRRGRRGKRPARMAGYVQGKGQGKKELTKGSDDYDIGDRYARRET